MTRYSNNNVANLTADTITGQEGTRSVSTNDVTQATNVVSVSGETTTFSAGAAGTTGTIVLEYGPVHNAVGSSLGALGDTSFAFVTGTVLTTEVAFDNSKTDTVQLAALSNGEYAIEYATGKLLYAKDTAGTTDTANYKYRTQNVTLQTGDLEIGAVEIKNGTDDTRLTVVTDDSAMPATPNILPLGGEYRSTLTTYADGDATVLQTDMNGKLRTSGGGGSAGAGGAIIVGYEKGAYAFDASAQTVTITGMETLTIERILKITNVTDQEVIYDSTDAGKGGTISGNVITLEYDTTSMADGDSLQLLVQNNNSQDYNLGSQKTIKQNLDRSDYVSSQEVISSAETMTDTVADVGSEIPCRGAKKMTLFMTTTIEQANDFRIAFMGKHESGGSEEMPLDDGFVKISGTTVTAPSTAAIYYWEQTEDVNADWCIQIDLQGGFDNIQIRAFEGTDGGDDATIDTLNVILSY